MLQKEFSNERINGVLDARLANHSLVRDFYVDDDIYAADIARIFNQQWLFAAPLAAFRTTGDYITLQLGRDPLLFIRGKDGVIRGFYNVCRHRGSKILREEKGNVRGKLTCPYHQWMYELDGAFAYASHTPEQPRADMHSLAPIHVAVLGGGVHFCLAQNPPPIDEAAKIINRYVEAYCPTRMKIAHAETHVVVANWKLLVENNRECGHCRGAHPELMECIYDFGLGGDVRGDEEYTAQCDAMAAECQRLDMPPETLDFPDDSFYRLARLPFRPGFLSETVAPQMVACKKNLGTASSKTGQLRTVLLPNCWGHYLSDYYVVTRLLPQGALSSRLDVFWMVQEDAVAGSDYDLKTLTEVWAQTTLQDTKLVANNQQGVLSSQYRPGPYSPITEVMVEHFVDWYIRQLRT